MESKITNIMDFADRLSVIENQKEILTRQFEENCMTYQDGHQITINPVLIATCKSYIDMGRTQNVSLLDDFNLPVIIENLETFLTDIADQYQQALHQYQIKYSELVKQRGDLDA